MKSRLGDEMTVVRTDFEWFGPSLPHLTMFAVLKYFRVSNRWIDFFRRVLEGSTDKIPRRWKRMLLS